MALLQSGASAEQRCARHPVALVARFRARWLTEGIPEVWGVAEMIGNLPRRNDALPPGDEGQPNAAFVEATLVPLEATGGVEACDAVAVLVV